jgi:hypothetical protein
VCGISVNEADIVNGYIRYTARALSLAIVFGILNSLADTRRFSGSNYIRYLNGPWGSDADVAEAVDDRSLDGIGRMMAHSRGAGLRHGYVEQRSRIEETISDADLASGGEKASLEAELSD